MLVTNRRIFLAQAAAATAVLPHSAKGALLKPQTGVTFSFGTYGMKSLSAEVAVREIAKAGFDGVELSALPDWDSAPARMTPIRRKELRRLMNDLGIRLTAFTAGLRPADDGSDHSAQLQQLDRIIELGHQLSPDETPVVQTILGSGQWEAKKQQLVHRLADWARLAERRKTVIGIKPHRAGAMSKPTQAVWIIRQLDDTPWLRMVYDYSHYAFRDLSIESTVQTALDYTAHIAVKDAVRKGQGTTFVLPGESGEFDYRKLFELFYQGGYRGDICCEVSSAVWSQSGYDPIAAARTCYQNIAPVLEQAQIPRRS